jgi:hypothetical protein
VGICRPETSPPAGSVIHLDAELGVSVSGGRVDEWDDQSAENQAVTQGTAADRPDDNANALNGIGGLRFDGGSDRLRIADDPEINNPGTFTEKSFGIVFRTGTDVDTRQVVYQQGGGTRGISIYIEDDDLVFCVWNQHSGGVQEFYDPICVEDTVTASTAYYTTYRFEGTSGLSGNITMTINENAEETTGGLGILYGHSGDVALGGVEGSAHFADNSVSHSDDGLLGGTIYEFISYNDNLSNTNRDKLKSYLRHKYGLD